MNFHPIPSTGDISLGNLFLGMTEDIADFIGDFDLAKVDLEIIQKLFPEWYDEVASSKRGALRTVSGAELRFDTSSHRNCIGHCTIYEYFSAQGPHQILQACG